MDTTIKWLSGLFFICLGTYIVKLGEILSGVFLIYAGLFCLPIVTNLIEAKINRRIPSKFKYITIIIMLCTSFLFVSNNAKESVAQKSEEQSYSTDVSESTKTESNEYSISSESRKKKIERHLSPWNGSHMKVSRRIKESLNDPDSYEHIETRYVDNGDLITVITKIRAKNSFGGKIITAFVATVDIEGNVLDLKEIEK